MLREKMLHMGRIPGFVVRAKDAMDVVSKEAKTIHLELRQEDHKATSRDVLAVIEGAEIKNESIVINGHYDSAFQRFCVICDFRYSFFRYGKRQHGSI